MKEQNIIQKDLELIQSIAKKMCNPIVVKEIVNDPSNKNPYPLFETDRWSDLSIGAGYPGVLPLFIELDSLFPQDRWDLVAHDYILQITKAVEFPGISSVTLFGGLTGVCLYLRQASKNGQRYKKLLDKLDNYLIQQVSLTHLTPFKEQLELSTPRKPALYELIQGLSGIGIYALVNGENPDFKELAQNIIRQLILLTRPIEIRGKIVPGWYVSPDYFFLESDREMFPNGNFNLGLSHGIPGALAFLSIALMSGVEIEGQKEAIQTIAEWIQTKRKKIDDRFFWDAIISFEEEISGQPIIGAKSRDAWCYGTPGVARSLYLAGKALNQEAIKEFAIESFISIFKSSREEWNLPGPTICHGIAGLLIITELMARDTHSVQLQLEVQKLRKILLAHYDASSHFGFKHAELQKNKKGEYAWLERADLLEGVSGVLLTLLSLNTHCSRWYLPFLIDTIDVHGIKK